MEHAMRAALMIGAAVAAFLWEVPSGHAYYYGYYRQGPWCAVENLGFGTVKRTCTFLTFESCRLQVIAGNRGGCEPNAYWTGPVVADKPLKRKRRARY
jgi:hypothetical protein